MGTGWGFLTRAVCAGFACAAALALPAAASAATFTVNDAGEQNDFTSGDGVCDWDDATAGQQCTLRAAIDQANSGAGSRDLILFAGTLEGQDLPIGSALVVTTPMVIDGGDCPNDDFAHKPCIGLNGPNTTDQGLVLDNGSNGPDDVAVRGLAMHDFSDAVFADTGADNVDIANSWFGIGLNGDIDGNEVGVHVRGEVASIGGTSSADRNVFVGNGAGTSDAALVLNSHDSLVRGNYFGVEPDGVTPQGNLNNAIDVTGQRNRIGATVSKKAAKTTRCDGGCNVISGSADDGILVDQQDTKIKGNFIGLDRTGTTPIANTSFGVRAESFGTVIGGAAGSRNFIAGNSSSGIAEFSGEGTKVKNNYIGLNSAGTAAVTAPATSAAFLRSSIENPTVVSKNRIAGDSGNGIAVGGEAATVTSNSIGFAKDGGSLSGPNIGIAVTAQNSLIGKPGEGNRIGNVDVIGIDVQAGANDTGDGNEIYGNRIGVNSGNGDVGIRLDRGAASPDDNIVGGDSRRSENVINNAQDDAIRLEDPFDAATGNQFKRNRGTGNGDPMEESDIFLDLDGVDGAGNGALQREAPTITDATRRRASGAGLEFATVYVFRTTATEAPPMQTVTRFVGKTTVTGLGGWEAHFDRIPVGQRLIALQIEQPSDGGDGSEFSGATGP